MSVSMQHDARLSGFSSDFELGVCGARSDARTGREAGYSATRGGLSLSDTVSVLAGLSVGVCRSSVHNWVQKACLQPASDNNPNHVAVDETVIHAYNQVFDSRPLSIPK